MGFSVKSSGLPDVTPIFSSNAGGELSWGGKHESALTAFDLVEILRFCKEEGYRQGWNDSLHDRPVAMNMFHPELLGGYPHREWEANYQRGGAEQFKDFLIHNPEGLRKIWPKP